MITLNTNINIDMEANLWLAAEAVEMDDLCLGFSNYMN
jgi:hypothetical protein